MTEEKTKYNFETTDLIVYLWKKKIPLIIITMTAAIISTLVSFTITPMFKSSVVLFPASESPVSKSLLQFGYQDRVGILGFGEEEQLERILQVLHSDDIRDEILERYKLMEHYEIDTAGPYPQTKLYGMYESNIKFRRTEFNSIIIEVLDHDPQMAADIANDISFQVDSTMNKMKLDRAMKAFELVEREYNEAKIMVRALNDTVTYYNNMGVISHDRQIDRLTEAYSQAVVNGNVKAADRLSRETSEFRELVGPFNYYWEYLVRESSRLRVLASKYIEAKADTELTLSNIFILDRAHKAEKKAYPKKTLIVLISTFATFLFAVILFLFFESFLKKIRSEE